MDDSLKRKTVKGVAWSAIERFTVQGINFVLGVLIARMVAPSDFGVIAMLTIFLEIAYTFVDCGFGNALVRKLDRTDVDNSTAFYSNIGIGVVCYFILFFAAPLIADFYRMPVLVPVLRVVALTIVCYSLAIVQQALLTANIDFKSQTKVSVAGALLSGLVGVAMAYHGCGVWALVVQMVGSSFIRMVMLWLCVRWKPIRAFSEQSFRSMFSYGAKLLVSELVISVSNNATGLIIGRRFFSSQLGFYNRAEQIAKYPSSNISAILQRVTFPVYTRQQNDVEAFRDVFLKMMRIASMLIVPVMLMLCVLARPLILTLLTDKWADAIPLMQILSFHLLWIPFFAQNVNVMYAFGKSGSVLKLESIKAALQISCILLAAFVSLEMVCYALVFVSLTSTFIYAYFTRRLIDVGWCRQMKCLLPYVLMSAVSMLAAYLLIEELQSPLLQLVFGLVLFSGLYFIMLALLDRKNMAVLKSLVKQGK